MKANEQDIPLCIDLDGTLLKTDTLLESLILLFRHEPLTFLRLPWWMRRGKAHLKRRVAERVHLPVDRLPYHRDLLRFLQEEKKNDRRILLVTAADDIVAKRISAHTGLFTETFGSDGQKNLRGEAKAALLEGRFGLKGFIYAGNSRWDLPVWEKASQAIVVGAKPSLLKRIENHTPVLRAFSGASSSWMILARALRLHQWIKNILIFFPLITAHRIFEPSFFLHASAAALSFSLAASAAYLVNDLFDLQEDRLHTWKQDRPLSAGDLSLQHALFLIIGCMLVSFLIATTLPFAFVVVLGTYVVLTTLYSLILKRLPLVDTFILAGLYILRIVAGHAATHVAYSAWLLLFALFLFFSLALMKRYTELYFARSEGISTLIREGYSLTDIEHIRIFGAVSASLAVLVLALYVNSEAVRPLYRLPQILWLLCPLLLYWVSRIWFLAARGEIRGDPILFAVRDPMSYVVGGIAAITMLAAT
jgi:4-hydroxybenzoate polyprenyltransferase/phosphoserine phosphatase